MRKIVLHIGANKTATTTLQRRLFATHPQLRYLGEDCADFAGYRPVLDSLVSDDDLFFDRERCAALFRSQLQQEPEKTFLYSNEDIMTSRVPTQAADRLSAFMGGAEVLLVVRNQLTAIPSFYASHGAYLKPAPPSHFRRHVPFDDWMTYCTTIDRYSPLTSYLYDTILSLYSDRFGRERTHVLMYEEFVQDREGFIRKLCAILDIDPDQAIRGLEGAHDRKRHTGRMLRYNRLRGRLLWGVPLLRYLPGGQALARALGRFLESGRPAAVPEIERWRDKISEFYGKENTALARRYNLPLRENGYPVG